MPGGRYDPYDFNANQPILPQDGQTAIAGGQAPATPLKPTKFLTKNPQLSATPLGAYTDSQYEAGNAQLRSDISKQYADILQQLGYQDDQGNFIPGTVEAGAQKQQAELQRSLGLATEEATQQAQTQGTLFSGLRAVNQARAEHPFVSALSDLATQTPLTLNKLYEDAAGLTDQYTLQNNLLLADAAARNAAKFQGSVGTPAPPDNTGGGGGTDPLAGLSQEDRDLINAQPPDIRDIITGGPTGDATDQIKDAYNNLTDEEVRAGGSGSTQSPGQGPYWNGAWVESDWERALRLQGEGMNDRYGLGNGGNQELSTTPAPAPTQPAVDPTFPWGGGPGQGDAVLPPGETGYVPYPHDPVVETPIPPADQALIDESPYRDLIMNGNIDFSSIPAPAPEPPPPPPPPPPAPKPTPPAIHYYTYKNQVPLGPGQVLDFAAGKGYYAR